MFNRDRLHEVASVTKSVTATLIGISLERHQIAGVEEKISRFLPQYRDIFANPDKAKLQLRHLLSMTAGLKWDETSYPPVRFLNDHIEMNRSRDSVRFVLERPVVAEPGTVFDYNSGLSITLGAILRNATGMPVDKFAEQGLFIPLGITKYYWMKYPDGTVQTGGGLWLRPRDMAKIGYLHLNGGRWRGTQILSEQWIRSATSVRAPGEGRDRVGIAWWAEKIGLPRWGGWTHRYGYQWWLGSFRSRDRDVSSYSARGRGGQFIFVFPSLELVVVFTGWNPLSLMNQPFEMIERHILPAALPK